MIRWLIFVPTADVGEDAPPEEASSAVVLK